MIHQVGATSQLVAEQEQRRLELQGEREAASLRAGYEVSSHCGHLYNTHYNILCHIVTFDINVMMVFRPRVGRWRQRCLRTLSGEVPRFVL